MAFFRLVKPRWGVKKLANGDTNPKFKGDVIGPNILEGADFSQEYLLSKNKVGYNVYFFPNHPSKSVYSRDVRYLNGRVIDVFNYVFLDMDLKDKIYATKEDFLEKLKQFPLTPTRVVDSGRGIHAYWKITDLTRDTYIHLQLQLIEYFDTDESVWTVLQLMRLPGFKNTKDFDNPVECKVLDIEGSGKVYTAKRLHSLLNPLSDELKKKGKLHLDRLEGRIEVNFNSADINEDQLSDRFIELLCNDKRISELFNDPTSQGDRSVADMTLAHLLYSQKFDYKEVLGIMMNTQKAISKGVNRAQYVLLTVNNVFLRRKSPNIQTVSEFLNDKSSRMLEPKVHGPYYMDEGVLGSPWRRKELLGIISGPGVGKTALALNIIKDIIQNNTESDEIFVFFSLEMTRGQVAQRWLKLVGNDSNLGDRLYIIDTTQSQEESQLGLQEIYGICKEIEQHTSKKINSIVIDHFHIMSTRIDLRKKPTFSIDSEQGTGYGNIRNMSKERMCGELKTLVKLLNVFGIILTQTTKARGKGYLPIQKDGCYGVSQYENIMDRIITVFQPLYLIQKEVNIYVTAFMYVKIREKHVKDLIWEQDPKVLTYDIVSGALLGMSPEEYQSFLKYLPLAKEARLSLDKGEVPEFTTI